ncbi:hypothetical protein Hanom_Chr06g00561891 [Helianthus anomalus]
MNSNIFFPLLKSQPLYIIYISTHECECLGDTEWHAAINGKLVCRAANTAAGKLGTRQRSNIGDGLPIREEGEGERGRVLWVGSIPISTNHTFFLFF